MCVNSCFWTRAKLSQHILTFHKKLKIILRHQPPILGSKEPFYTCAGLAGLPQDTAPKHAFRSGRKPPLARILTPPKAIEIKSPRLQSQTITGSNRGPWIFPPVFPQGLQWNRPLTRESASRPDFEVHRERIATPHQSLRRQSPIMKFEIKWMKEKRRFCSKMKEILNN